MMESTCSCCGSETHPFHHGYQCTICDHFQRKLPFDPAQYYADLKDRNPGAQVDSTKKFNERLQSLRPLLRDGMNILEIGCAEGTLGQMIKKEFKVNYTGVEPSLDAGNANGGLDLVVSDIASLKNNEFDLVLSFHVLEHFEDVRAALSTWKSKLKNQTSQMIIEVPNRAGNPSIEVDQNIEHAHQFTSASLELLAKNAGLETLALSSGLFESANYRDSLRIRLRIKRSASEQKDLLLQAIKKNLGEDFYIWGTGGDFVTYLSPFITDFKFAGLIDSKPSQDNSIMSPENCDFKHRKVLISSLRFKQEITKNLIQRGVDPKMIFGLDDLFSWIEP